MKARSSSPRHVGGVILVEVGVVPGVLEGGVGAVRRFAGDLAGEGCEEVKEALRVVET